MTRSTRLLPCTACGSENVSELLNIRDVPVHCNMPRQSYEDALRIARGDIRLGFCGDCGHLYNTVFDAGRVEYAPGYENCLLFSPRFERYSRSLAQRLIDQYALREKDVIEIACGSGEFLRLICELGNNRGVGFDPSHTSYRTSDNLDITVIRDLYSQRYSHYEADLVICRQALEHIQYPLDFLLTLHDALVKRGDCIVFFEVPNSLFTLKDLGVWDLIYEHCSYFCARSLAQVFFLSGFEVLEIFEAFDDQYLCVIARPTEGESRHIPSIMCNAENHIAKHTLTFEQNYKEKVRSWSRRLKDITNKNERVVVWGAGSKGITFLNILRSAGGIKHVVDINPRKQGKFIAGTGQMIVSPEFLSRYQPDYIIAMNPIYRDEIDAFIVEKSLPSRLLMA